MLLQYVAKSRQDFISTSHVVSISELGHLDVEKKMSLCQAVPTSIVSTPAVSEDSTILDVQSTDVDQLKRSETSKSSGKKRASHSTSQIYP